MAKKKKDIRQPIIAVMGHVDHGKTSFLDAIRGARVAEKEHGGITQNTRVHEVETKSGQKMTFIDTPGHEAFSNMRSRGAQVTDFVLLIVAADDGVQPQTKESIEFALENEVPIIVAINKVDLPGVDLTKVKTELASHGVQVEEYGGEILAFEISAKEKKGLGELLEGIELMCEVNEISSKEVKEDILAEAFVLESMLDKHIGYRAMCVLKAGNLDDRYFGVTKNTYFKVRAYMDENVKPLKQVHEAQPFIVTGLKQDLVTGDSIYFVKTEDEAKEYLKKLQSGEVQAEEDGEENKGEDLDAADLFAQMLSQREDKKEGVEQKEVSVVLKTSTQGTLEAAKEQIEGLEGEDAKIAVISSGTGPVTEDDLNMAQVAGGLVLAFQTEVPKKVRDIALRDKIIVRHYDIIYDMIDEVADVLDSVGANFEQEVEMAEAEVKQVFVLSDGSHVAGCKVTDNSFKKGYNVIVARGDEEIARTKLSSLKINKDEAKEVKKGKDCGMQFNPDVPELKEGDTIIAYRIDKM